MVNLVFGPALIPNKKIYRGPNEAVSEPHFIVFEAETISQIRDKFHKKNFDNKVNINHSGVLLNGLKMTKSFLINSENKLSLPIEFVDLPIGTWMIEYEVENEEVWKMIEANKIKGFSVEGIFAYAQHNDYNG